MKTLCAQDGKMLNEIEAIEDAKALFAFFERQSQFFNKQCIEGLRQTLLSMDVPGDVIGESEYSLWQAGFLAEFVGNLLCVVGLGDDSFNEAVDSAVDAAAQRLTIELDEIKLKLERNDFASKIYPAFYMRLLMDHVDTVKFVIGDWQLFGMKKTLYNIMEHGECKVQEEITSEEEQLMAMFLMERQQADGMLEEE